MFEVLDNKGHKVKLNEFKSGHDYLSWADSFAEGIEYLFKKVGG